MKQPHEWNETDIHSLIKEEVPESLHLDYKRSDSLGKTKSKKDEISKDVSAFANSDGGVIIYGVIEKDNYPSAIDEGVDQNEYSKEWLEQVINSRIQRRIPNIRINQIQLSKSATNVIYVVEIPQSHLSPHMAGSKKYYKRFNFESTPMEEYEVRDISNRNLAPELEFKIGGDGKNLTYPTGKSCSNPIECEILLMNHSVAAAEYVTVRIHIDTRVKVNTPPNMASEQNTITAHKGSNKYNLNSYYIHHTVPHSMPILNGVWAAIGNGKLKLSVPTENDAFLIIGHVYTVGTTPKKFIYELLNDEGILKIQNVNE